MGLDSVELVIEVEERFDVTISDEEAGAIRTVGDLLELVDQRVKRRQSTTCLSLGWFLKLRSTTRDAASDPALRIRTGDKLIEVLTGRQRSDLWDRLSKQFDTSLPFLRRPKVFGVTFGMLALAWLIVGFVGVANGSYSALLSYLACGGGLLVVFLATEPLRTYPPLGYETFGEITRRLVGLEALTVGFPAGDRSLLLEELASIVSEQLGVERDEVVPEARFVEDLNIG